jgi:hypothetical protein
MKVGPRIWMCVLVMLAAGTALRSHNSGDTPATFARKLKMPGPVVQDLMLGTWALQLKVEPSAGRPKGEVATGREIWRAGPDGKSVIEEYSQKSSDGEFELLSVGWWDEKEKGQRFLNCDSSQEHGCELSKEVARWEGNSLVYTEEREEKGAKVVRQEIFTDIQPMSFTQILKSGPSSTELKTEVTINATKQTQGAAKK